MTTAHAKDGTVRGILPGSNPEAPPLLLGSHIDTVINAGKYDGPLGVISALAALELLAEQNITLPFPVHLLAFSDEEGVRFQTTYLGSRSIIGELDYGTLNREDAKTARSLAFVLATTRLARPSGALSIRTRAHPRLRRTSYRTRPYTRGSQ